MVGVGSPYPAPTRRPLRVFPFDAMVGRQGDVVIANTPYEALLPGPFGRLVEVVDFDATNECYYEPVDLDNPAVLLNSGVDALDTDPRFHQQMTYAVTMGVLETFERSLGRAFRWRGDRRLRIYPHAFEQANAFFDENSFSLLFGYFRASDERPGENLPGQTVFTCLSHDIIAHEATHAAIHRLRPYFNNPTNPDVLALHEGVSDIVAVLEHFKYKDVVSGEVNRTRADLSQDSPLLDLGPQFGHARGLDQPLRPRKRTPTTLDYAEADGPHQLGQVLSGAVFDAFLRASRRRIARPLRLATAGTGELQPGALHPDLVAVVAGEASATAERILRICIRAIDYLPPVDVTFSDYLRAMVTTDADLFPDDEIRLRADLIESFRTRGIYPTDAASLAETSLRIPRVDDGEFEPFENSAEGLLQATIEQDRRARSRTEYVETEDASTGAGLPGYIEHAEESTSRDSAKRWAVKLHGWALRHADKLGFDAALPVAVVGFNASQRPNGDGLVSTTVVAQFVQRRPELASELGGIVPMGGATVVADGEGNIRYVMAKPVPGVGARGVARLARLREFVDDTERTLPAVTWSHKNQTRLVDHLNLRAVDGYTPVRARPGDVDAER